MSDSSKYFDMSLLSEAAYVLLEGIDFESDDFEIDEYKERLQSANFNGKMTEELADYFVTNYEVVSSNSDRFLMKKNIVKNKDVD